MTKKEHNSGSGSGDHLKSAAEIAAEKSTDLMEQPAEAGVGISPKEIESLRAQAAKAQENWDKLLRSQADLENYRKRVARERQDLIQSANEKLLLELLAPLDHFEMGLQSVRTRAEDDPLRHGMEMVLSQFQQFLKSQGVTEVQSLGQTFDPSLHEAVAHQPSEAPEGRVIQQLRKGYRLKDKLLRPASVVVSKGSAESSQGS